MGDPKRGESRPHRVSLADPQIHRPRRLVSLRSEGAGPSRSPRRGPPLRSIHRAPRSFTTRKAARSTFDAIIRKYKLENPAAPPREDRAGGGRRVGGANPKPPGWRPPHRIPLNSWPGTTSRTSDSDSRSTMPSTPIVGGGWSRGARSNTPAHLQRSRMPVRPDRLRHHPPCRGPGAIDGY